MSDKVHQPMMSSSSGPNRQTSLDSDTVNRIKSEIIGGPGLPGADQTRSPRKAASPRPRSRERQAVQGSAPSNLLPLESTYHRIANEKVSTRQGDKVSEMTALEAVVRSQMKSAIGGNPRSQDSFIRAAGKAEAREAAKVAKNHELWNAYCEIVRDEIAEAKRLGLPAPTRLPHPDDVVIEDGKPVRFIGPVNEEERKSFEELVRWRDHMILWNELDERVRKLRSKPTPMEQMSAAYFLLMTIQDALPLRMRLDNIELMLRQHRVHCMSMRVLLKTLHAGWRALGRPRKRGTLPPTLDEAVRNLKFVNDFVGDFQPGKLDIDKMSRAGFDALVIEKLKKAGFSIAPSTF
jgi:hypothetical protein